MQSTYAHYQVKTYGQSEGNVKMSSFKKAASDAILKYCIKRNSFKIRFGRCARTEREKERQLRHKALDGFET